MAYGYIDGYDPKTMLFEQFAGFYDMDDVPIEKLRPRPMAADLLLGRDVTLGHKVVKQADVVMLCHILSDEIDEETARANYDYYEPITCHGSSLSPGIHAAVAARLRRRGRRPWRTSRWRPPSTSPTTWATRPRGLHMATMGGLWQAAVMGFAGLQRRHEALLIDPHLPHDWKRVRVPLWFRGARAEFDLRRTQARRPRGYNRGAGGAHGAAGRRGARAPPGKHRLRRADGGPWEVVVK